MQFPVGLVKGLDARCIFHCKDGQVVAKNDQEFVPIPRSPRRKQGPSMSLRQLCHRPSFEFPSPGWKVDRCGASTCRIPSPAGGELAALV